MNCQELETAKRLGTAFVCGHLGEPPYGRSANRQEVRAPLGTDFTNTRIREVARPSGCRGVALRVGGRLQDRSRQGLGFSRELTSRR